MDSREKWIEALVARYGPLIGGSELRELLGFRTAAAMQRAVRQRLMKAPVFPMEGRRGLFALTGEIAEWLLQERAKALTKPLPHPHQGGADSQTM